MDRARCRGSWTSCGWRSTRATGFIVGCRSFLDGLSKRLKPKGRSAAEDGRPETFLVCARNAVGRGPRVLRGVARPGKKVARPPLRSGDRGAAGPRPDSPSEVRVARPERAQGDVAATGCMTQEDERTARKDLRRRTNGAMQARADTARLTIGGAPSACALGTNCIHGRSSSTEGYGPTNDAISRGRRRAEKRISSTRRRQIGRPVSLPTRLSHWMAILPARTIPFICAASDSRMPHREKGWCFLPTILPCRRH